MVNILPTKKGFSQQLFENVSNAGSQLPELLGGMQEKKANEKLSKDFKEKFGHDLPPEAIKEFYKEFAKGLGKQSFPGKLDKTERKQLESAKQGIETIKRQQERLKTGHLGPKISFNPFQLPKLFSALSPEGRKTRSAYEQAGKELIQLSSTLPIRNRIEFEVLGEKLYDPTMNESDIEGIYEEMAHHVQDAIDSIEGIQGTQESTGKGKKQLTADIVNSLLDETGNDTKKAKKLAADRGYTW